jgi:hypothetical protein
MKRLLLITVTLGAIIACSEVPTRSGETPPAPITGTFTLSTVNGNALPFAASTTASLTADEWNLKEDHSYQRIAKYTIGGVSRDSVTLGSYGTTNNNIGFNQTSPARLFTGTFTATGFTVSALEGTATNTYVFVKK